MESKNVHVLIFGWIFLHVVSSQDDMVGQDILRIQFLPKNDFEGILVQGQLHVFFIALFFYF